MQSCGVHTTVFTIQEKNDMLYICSNKKLQTLKQNNLNGFIFVIFACSVATADSMSVCWRGRTLYTTLNAVYHRDRPEHWLYSLQSPTEEHMSYKGFGCEEEKEDGSTKA